MGGVADYRVVSQQSTRKASRNVVLTHMYPVSARVEREIRSVVQDERNAEVAADRGNQSGKFHDPLCRGILFAQLYDIDATFDAFADETDQVLAVGGAQIEMAMCHLYTAVHVRVRDA
jgi:hypothetical protein